MLGIIFKLIEGFVRSRHGEGAWLRIVEATGLGFSRFEALRLYETDLAPRVCRATGRELGVGTFQVLEDIGHWICTDADHEPVRRLIRFNGATFADLLVSFEEVHDRAAVALPDLDLPVFRLDEIGDGAYEIDSDWKLPGASAVLRGVLRAMADDYGTLALIDGGPRRRRDGIWHERTTIRIVEELFQRPREFTLGGAA